MSAAASAKGNGGVGAGPGSGTGSASPRASPGRKVKIPGAAPPEVKEEANAAEHARVRPEREEDGGEKVSTPKRRKEGGDEQEKEIVAGGEINGQTVKVEEKEHAELPQHKPAGGLDPTRAKNSLQSGAYAEREAWLSKQERDGNIRFECVSSSAGNILHLQWILALKNIYSRQLPNMPKEYIVRLVYDKHHYSMVALKHDKVFGGCTFRCFDGQTFGEIVFLAIAAQEQVRGYGTRLMNRLKEYARGQRGLTHFLTYADNNAIGYFQKQGFTREIFLQRDKWGGYIKDYEGGTLMECALDYHLPYAEFSKMIPKQRAFLDSFIRKISKSHIEYPGLKQFRDLKPGEYKAIRIEDIPGVMEAGYDEALARKEGPQYQLVTPAGLTPPSISTLHSFMTKVHAAVVDHPDSWPFKEPVDRLEVPDYYQIVKDPLDLSLIAHRLCSYEYYIRLEIFVADFKCMFKNARTYNAPDTVYFKCANRLESFFDNKIMTGIAFI